MGMRPGSKFVGRSEVLEPGIQSGFLLSQAARPQTIDQHSRAVFRGRLFVDALNADGHGFALLLYFRFKAWGTVAGRSICKGEP